MVTKVTEAAPFVATERISEEDGIPSNYFLRQWAAQRRINETTDAVIDEVVAVQGIDLIAGVGLAGGGDLSGPDRTFDLKDTTVTPGDFTNANITVDQQGRITAASSGSGANLFIAGMFFPGGYTDSQLLMRYVFDRSVDFLDDFAGARGSVVTNPTAAATFDVQRNGSSIGTISITTGGVVTFVTVGGEAESFVVGDTLEIIAQATADATLADTSITLNGTRV